jgi:hypothetical protein
VEQADDRTLQFEIIHGAGFAKEAGGFLNERNSVVLQPESAVSSSQFPISGGTRTRTSNLGITRPVRR